jgi:hypothetical protein
VANGLNNAIVSAARGEFEMKVKVFSAGTETAHVSCNEGKKEMFCWI